MGNRSAEDKRTRTITKNNSGSYNVTLPIDLIRQLCWQNHQQVVIQRRGKKLIIEDRE